ncbi:hypothetical protein WOLCODRAFT_153973 [Wolfiporia cocos MD-104 SS10]|uniref:Uncharacterized protein n=1 Tax=Wolfiporia cocos (strain MD-104) TaxID=742152 RepID=A0A2H3JYE1_WOLCO|nr:hypothetical protein WOLCODRAFT_153973 [Wolfiporia cocos MD-104 SS10]
MSIRIPMQSRIQMSLPRSLRLETSKERDEYKSSSTCFAQRLPSCSASNKLGRFDSDPSLRATVKHRPMPAIPSFDARPTSLPPSPMPRPLPAPPAHADSRASSPTLEHKSSASSLPCPHPRPLPVPHRPRPLPVPGTASRPGSTASSIVSTAASDACSSHSAPLPARPTLSIVIPGARPALRVTNKAPRAVCPTVPADPAPLHVRRRRSPPPADTRAPAVPARTEPLPAHDDPAQTHPQAKEDAADRPPVVRLDLEQLMPPRRSKRWWLHLPRKGKKSVDEPADYRVVINELRKL